MTRATAPWSVHHQEDARPRSPRRYGQPEAPRCDGGPAAQGEPYAADRRRRPRHPRPRRGRGPSTSNATSTPGTGGTKVDGKRGRSLRVTRANTTAEACPQPTLRDLPQLPHHRRRRTSDHRTTRRDAPTPRRPEPAAGPPRRARHQRFITSFEARRDLRSWRRTERALPGRHDASKVLLDARERKRSPSPREEGHSCPQSAVGDA